MKGKLWKMVISRGTPRVPKKKANTLPRHGKAFAVPIRLSPLGRKQVGITPFVKSYVNGFKQKGLKGISLARAIVEDIASFKTEEVSHKMAQELWAKRSAEEIIRTRKAIAVKPSKEETGKHRNVIMGCNDKAQAAVSALRAAGFKTLIAREFLHTYAKMLLMEKGKATVFIVDPSEEKRNRIRKMTLADKRMEENRRRAGCFAEGTSLAQIGIESYNNFFGCGPEPLR